MNIDLIEMIAKATGKDKPQQISHILPPSTDTPAAVVLEIPSSPRMGSIARNQKDTPAGSNKSIKLSVIAGSTPNLLQIRGEKTPTSSSYKIEDRYARSRFDRSMSNLGSELDKEEDDILQESDFNKHKPRPNAEEGLKELEDESFKQTDDKSSMEQHKLLEQVKYEAMYSLFNQRVMDKLMKLIQEDAKSQKDVDMTSILLGLSDQGIPWDKVVDIKLECIRGFKGLQSLRLPPSLLNDHSELQVMLRNKFKKLSQEVKNKKLFGGFGGDSKDEAHTDRIAVVSSSANLPASRIADLNRRNQLVSLHEELLTQLSQGKKSLEISKSKLESLKVSHQKLEDAYKVKRDQLEEKVMQISLNIKLVTNYQLNKHRHAEKGGPVSQELIIQEQKVQELLMQSNGGKSSFLINEDMEGVFTLLIADLKRTKFIHQKEIKDLIDHKREHLGIKGDYLKSLEKYVGNLEENLAKMRKRLSNMYFFLLTHPRDIALLDLTVIEVLRYLRGQQEDVRAENYSVIFDEKSIQYIQQVLENETKFKNLSRVRNSVLSTSMRGLQSKVEEAPRPKDPIRKEIESKTSELIRSAIDVNRSRVKGKRSPRNRGSENAGAYPAEDEFLRKDILQGVELIRAPEQAGDDEFFQIGELSNRDSIILDPAERQELGKSIFEVTSLLNKISTQEINRLLVNFINKGFYPEVAEQLMILLSCLFGKRAAHKAMGIYIHKKTRETFLAAAEEIKKSGEDRSKQEVEDRVETIKRRVREFFVKLD
jgi:hypothetical protein